MRECEEMIMFGKCKMWFDFSEEECNFVLRKLGKSINGVCVS